MIITESDLQHFLPEVLNIAHAAGTAIMDIYSTDDAGESRKQDGSPLTLADIAANGIISRGLASLRPDIPLLSEEAAVVPYSERKKWDVFWLVDPLDGTREFLKRNGEFTVNIALIKEGQPVLGVVYAPALGESYYAVHGGGAFRQKASPAEAKPTPIKVPHWSPGTFVRVVASRSHADPRTAGLIERLGEHELVSMGSSLKLCLVAEGKADLYPRLAPTMEWDTAAAHAIVAEAGGAVFDLHGNELQYGKEDLHNPEFIVCHAEHKALLADLVGTLFGGDAGGKAGA